MSDKTPNKFEREISPPAPVARPNSDTEKMGKPIVFFDVDKTLMDGYVAYHTVMDLIRRGIIQKRHIAKAVIYNLVGHLFKQMNVRHMYELALTDLAGHRVEEIMGIGLEIFKSEIMPHLFVEGMEEIKQLKREGFQVVLLSSGPYMIVKNMEPFMKADDSFSVRPHIKNGILLNTIEEPLAYQEGKLIVANQFAERYEVHLKDCGFYTDAYADLPLLEMVGRPHVVNPDQYLRREAETRGWPISEYKKTLGELSREELARLIPPAYLPANPLRPEKSRK